MICSIVMATKNKAQYLENTLNSIFVQKPGLDFEVIVVDDGSTDNTRVVCANYPVRYFYTENSSYRNPAKARNIGYRAALGDIIIAQSDEVIHVGSDTIEQLCNRLHAGIFLIATVYNYDVAKGKRVHLYTGMDCKRPFFFLGSLWRKDLYAIGGCDEEFTSPGYDDDWFGDCLMQGLGLRPVFVLDVIGHHQDHPRPHNLASLVIPSRNLYKEKVQSGRYCSSGGPWAI